MRTYDFAPLWRSSVGFDRLFDLINETQRLDAKTTTRPTTSYVRATTGTVFRWLSPASRPTRSPSPRSRTSSPSSATRLSRKNGTSPEHQYLYQGISARRFERQFNLEDHVEVEGAAFENGLLQIELARKIPEAMKPRQIEIGGTGTRKTERMKTVEQVRAAS